MAIVGLSRQETEVFYSARDKNKETPFTLGTLTVEQRAKHLDNLMSMRGGEGDGTGVSIVSKKNQVYLVK